MTKSGSSIKIGQGLTVREILDECKLSIPFFKSRPNPLPAAAGSILDIFSVFLQQDISVLSAGTVRGRDIVPFCLQPVDDLFDGIIGRLSAFSAEISHYIVKTNNSDLYIIREGKYVPANWRRRVSSPVFSPLLVIM